VRRAEAAEVPSPDLSVVIPVYNEEACLEPLWHRLHPVLEGLGRRWEVVFVDDGSTDRSAVLLGQLRREHPGVRLLRLERNRGQTEALDAGFRAARGVWIATLDADLQNPPDEIPRLLAASDGVQLVYGRRKVRRDDWRTRMASRVGNAVRNWVTGHRVRDTGCSLKLYRREALARIPLFRGMHRFLPTLFAFHGFAIREIEVEHAPRVGGVSKYGIGNRALRGLADCFAVRWMRRRCLSYRVHEDGDDDA
jgi:glycosyltransferase involved in cell wall biosynthesis